MTGVRIRLLGGKQIYAISRLRQICGQFSRIGWMPDEAARRANSGSSN
jgi:hypothetical protein